VRSLTFKAVRTSTRVCTMWTSCVAYAGKVVASVPDKIQFMSDSGPAIFVSYACGAYNEAP
jgi:hypothetical protein